MLRDITLPEANIAPEIGHAERKLVFQPSICGYYVSLPEGIVAFRSLEFAQTSSNLVAVTSHIHSNISSIWWEHKQRNKQTEFKTNLNKQMQNQTKWSIQWSQTNKNKQLNNAPETWTPIFPKKSTSISSSLRSCAIWSRIAASIIDETSVDAFNQVWKIWVKLDHWT